MFCEWQLVLGMQMLSPSAGSGRALARYQITCTPFKMDESPTTFIDQALSAQIQRLCSNPQEAFPSDCRYTQYGRPEGHPEVLRAFASHLRHRFPSAEIEASDLVSANGERHFLLLLLNHLAPSPNQGFAIQLLGKWDASLRAFLKELGFLVTEKEEIKAKKFPDCSKLIILTKSEFVPRMLKVKRPEGWQIVAVICRESLQSAPLFTRLKVKGSSTEGVISYGVFSDALHLSWGLMDAKLRGEFVASAALESGGCPNTTSARLLADAFHP